MSKQPGLFLAMPHYGPIEAEAAKMFWCASADADRCERLDAVNYSSSLLALAFNTLWCMALNLREERGYTHFAMLHADIVPEPNWVHTLLEELEAHKADVVSAVIPIKNTAGVTSTALGDPYDTFKIDRRLTMHEVDALPFDTFDADALGYPERALLINTGCWVCDFRKPWVEHVRFTIADRIKKGDDGKFSPCVSPEDWDFSRQVRACGGRVFATRKVKARHFGPHGYPNYSAWGTAQMDHLAAGEPLRCLKG